MSKISIEEICETIVEDDAKKFYEILSKCIGKTLNPATDTIFIHKPPWGTRNTSQNQLLLCKINDSQYVGLKRCADNPEYMRRELSVARAKQRLNFLDYNMIETKGLILRDKTTDTNYKLLRGWETVKFLVIDFGNMEQSRTFDNAQKRELQLSDIKDVPKFFFDYGKWAAFNYLLGVQDVNRGNFIFFIDTQILHSIDNEDGPFDGHGREMNVDHMITNTKQNIEKYFPREKQNEYIQYLKNGFLDGWKIIKSNISSLDMFSQIEFKLLCQRADEDENEIAKKILYVVYFILNDMYSVSLLSR